MKSILWAAGLLAAATSATPAMAQVGSGIYLRLDAGGAFSGNGGITFEDTAPNNPNSTLGTTKVNGHAGPATFGDAGIGYRFSPHFRADVTLSYSPSLKFTGHDPFGLGADSTAKIKPWTAFLNNYVDFAPLAGMPASGVQPFLVFSLGASRNEVRPMTTAQGAKTLSIEEGAKVTEFAWGIGAGVGFPLGRFVTFDLTYKYMDLGEMRTSGQFSFISSTGGPFTATPTRAGLQLHTVTAGFRVGF